MDIIQMLKQDHKEISYMLYRLEGGATGTPPPLKSRHEIFNKLCAALILHTDFEEHFFYLAIKCGIKNLALQSYEENKVIKTLIKELENLSVEDEKWGAKFSLLKEKFMLHMEAEENELFPAVKELLDLPILHRLSEEYLVFREEGMVAV